MKLQLGLGIKWQLSRESLGDLDHVAAAGGDQQGDLYGMRFRA